MMKPGVPVFVVESVERAVKFYTEKLAFDIAELAVDPDARHVLNFAMVRKGKCYVSFRTPVVEELAEFSLIKRCTMRGAGIYVPMKKGLDRYFERCNKKKIVVLDSPTMQKWGDRTFSIRDPFGLKVTFAEPIVGFQPPAVQTFLGMSVEDSSDDSLEGMINWLKGYGVLRRAAKKYSKLWIKRVFGVKKTG